MIKSNWDIFSSKFSTEKELMFEWFSYLLFCREFHLPKGWFGFKNQSGIEKNPIEYENQVIGFQAKFYSTSLSDHKEDFLEMLEKAKRDYPQLTKILVYTNQLWGQAYSKKEKKMNSPQALVDIETKAKELNILLEWREASYFESEFVTLEHDDLSKYFFTEEPLQGWQRFDDWSNTKANIEEEYLVDNDIKVITPQNINNSELNVVDGINSIRNKLSNGGTSVRLVGLSGVGKTRFAQALFDKRIGENNLDLRTVWYCDIGDSPNPLPEHFIEALMRKNKPYILIIDNCGQDTHANLTKKIQNTEIALLTIEYDVKDDRPERTDVFKLKPNSTNIIKKVIERHYPDVNDVNRYKIAEFSGGNYRLALAIASNIKKTDNLALLTDNQLFERLFWQNGEKNNQLEKVAQQFSLVHSFNVEDSSEEDSEIDFLATLAKVDSETAYEEIEKLRQKDIVQQRSKWRAILPHAVSNHLAKQAILRKSVAMLNRDFEQFPKRLKRSYIKRLSYLHDQEKVQELIKQWLLEDGWLGKALFEGTYSTEDIIYFNLLAPIVPSQTLELLQYLNSTNSKFLTSENPSLNELSRLIRRLAYREEYFKQAFELLVYFIKDEKEDERNNSIKDLIVSLFKLHTSETLANLELKKEVLLELLKNEDQHSLLLNIINKALNFEDYGMLYNYEDSGEPLSYGYQPKNWEEIFDWVDFLLGLLQQLDMLDVANARNIFVNNLKSIILKLGRINEVEKYLISINERKYFSTAYTKITAIINNSKDEIEKNSPQLLQEIINIQNYLTPKENDITELLEAYVFVSDQTIYRLTKDEDDQYALPIYGFESYEELIEFLISELKNEEILNKNFEKLINAQHGFFSNKYLEKLGKSSSTLFKNTQQCIDKLKEINVLDTLHISEFLTGIVKNFKKRSLDDYRILIEYLISDIKFKNLFNLLIIETSETDEDFDYFSKLIREKKISINIFPRLSANKYHKRITNYQFEVLLDALLDVGEIKQVQYELLEECFFQKFVAKKYINILINNFYEVISNDNLYDHIEDALKFIFTLDQEIKNKFLGEIKGFLASKPYISVHRYSKIFNLLKICVEQCTTKFISLFLEDEDFLEKFGDGDLLKVLVNANEQEVIAWIDKDQDKLKFWLRNSRLFKIKDNGEIEWLDLLCKLLNNSSTQEESLTQIIETNIFRLRSATGSWSEEMIRRIRSLIALKTKLETSHPHLLSLIDQKEIEWLKRIEIQTIKDDADSKKRSERFDW